MEISKVESEKDVVLKIKGKIDIKASKEFEKALNDAFEKNPENVKVDLGSIISISSAALRTLVAFKKRITREGSQLFIENVSTSLKEVFDITGFSAMLDI